MNMRRSRSVGLAAVTILAVLSVGWWWAPSAPAQIGPPGVGPVNPGGPGMTPHNACYANITGVSVPPATPIWVPPVAGGRPGAGAGYWYYTFPWTFTFTCNTGNFAMCQVCARVELEWWNPRMGIPPGTGGWIISNVGPSRGTGQKPCQDAYKSGSTYALYQPTPYGFYRATWYLAEWDPDRSADCTSQDYYEYAGQRWQVPPPGGTPTPTRPF
jgi:hypothetical protein